MPYSLRRLRELIKKTKPKGLLFLSGDVHFGSIIGKEESVIEVTSSSVNQENIFSYINKYVIFFLTNILSKVSPFELNKIYSFNNFGSVNITYVNDNEIKIKTSVNDSDGVEILVANQVFNNKNNIYTKTKDLHIILDEFATLECKSKTKVVMHTIVYILFLLWFLQIIYIFLKVIGSLFRRKKIDTKTKDE
ncbi:hypothetical protein PFDG_01714 [Plasmodium falciparum Dd2]|nr:hypothetical protein PFNF54_02545 [Plasmodium falciparum NF54]KOB86297.1 hypothetical protein PFDG_01714 [Plasmodium falciparum Dd2]